MFSQDCFACRWDGCSHVDGPRSQIALVYSNRVPGDGLGASKGSLRDSGHRTLDIPIHVTDVRNSGGVVDDRRVVNIRDSGCINDCVRDVDAIYVSLAHTI